LVPAGPWENDRWHAEGPGGFRVVLTVIRPRRDVAWIKEPPGSAPWRPEDLAGARHPNLVSVFGCWPIDGCFVLVSELAEPSLRDRLAQVLAAGSSGIEREELAEYLAEAAKAIDFLGQHPRFGGHGRVRPHTLRLVGGGVKLEFPVPLCWRSDREVNRTTDGEATGAGGLPYTAPELVRGAAVSCRADQFSLAAVYCRLRGGRHPFPDLDLAGYGGPPLATSAFSRRLDLSMVPAEERSVLARALADDPARRWASCRAFVEGLRASLRVAVTPVVSNQIDPGPEDTTRAVDRALPKAGRRVSGLKIAPPLADDELHALLQPLPVEATTQRDAPSPTGNRDPRDGAS
jgi:serine/threonine protein kinase